MIKNLKYILIFCLGVFLSYLIFFKKKQSDKIIQSQVILNEIKNVRKLVVSESNFSEIYNYQSAQKYFFDTFQFDKKVILVVNAKVQVLFDLSKMDVEIDSIKKTIIIKSIPKEEINISPDISYYDFQQSAFNSFSKDELNKIHEKSIDRLKETIDLSSLKKDAKDRLFEELNKIYVIAKLLNWQVIDGTEQHLLEDFIVNHPLKN